MNTTLTLKSGKTLSLGIAPFSVARKLLKIVALELKQVDVELDVKSLQALMQMELGSEGLNTFKNVICQLISSDAVETCLWECFARCTIDNVKIVQSSFDGEQAREDYIPAAWEVIKLNLRPFFAGLQFGSSTNPGAKTDSPA
jgi:hypothetical protein